MEKLSQNYAVFYARFKKAHEGGAAWLLEDISVDKKLEDVQITSSYFPKSQLDFSIEDEKNKIIRCIIPMWLWDSKVEEANKFKPKTESEFDQFEKLFATK